MVYSQTKIKKPRVLPYKQRSIHFSQKTGTKRVRDKKKTKQILSENEMNKALLKNKENNFQLEKLEVIKNEENYLHKKIKRYKTDELIFELNEDNIKKQKKNILEFAKVLTRMLPKDISDNCIHYALNNIHIETNIFNTIVPI